MLVAVLRGSQMGPGEGWFGPAQSRYSWKWLADRCGVDPAKGGIPRDRFRGPEAWFARLDRQRPAEDPGTRQAYRIAASTGRRLIPAEQLGWRCVQLRGIALVRLAQI
jgi:hypothetical protein